MSVGSLAGLRVVRTWATPEAWTLADRAGIRVCICAWLDGAADSGRPESTAAPTSKVSEDVKGVRGGT